MNGQGINYSNEWALSVATEIAKRAGCNKSQRGVLIFSREQGLLAYGVNEPPHGFCCDGSEACRAACSRVAVHAEQNALLDAVASSNDISGAEMLHVKVRNGVAVPSGPPSCIECSKLILQASIATMWLYQEVEGELHLVPYTAEQFHRATLEHCGLPVIQSEEGPHSDDDDDNDEDEGSYFQHYCHDVKNE